MSYPTKHNYPSHRNCRNFVNGTCRLTGARVDTKDPVCPLYISKSKTKTTMALSHNRSRMKRIFDYPNHPLKHQQKSTKTVKAQEKKALVQHLEKLERQLKEVNEKLEKLSHIKEHFS